MAELGGVEKVPFKKISFFFKKSQNRNAKQLDGIFSIAYNEVVNGGFSVV